MRIVGKLLWVGAILGALGGGATRTPLPTAGRLSACSRY